MKSAVTISLVPETKGGPFVFSEGLADGCRRAAELGFDGVEIFPPAADRIEQQELTQLLSEHKLRVAAIGTGAGWVTQKLSLTHPDPAIRMRARTFVRQIIDVAAKFNAPAIIGSMQGRFEASVTHAQAAAWLAAALDELGDHAATQGQVLLLEPLNRYETNLFNRLADVAAFLDKVRSRNLRILADLFHMSIEEASIPDALRATASYLGHVHFADSNRRAIGFGHTEVPPIIAALRQVAYKEYLSAEVLPLPDSDTAARQTIQSFGKFNS